MVNGFLSDLKFIPEQAVEKAIFPRLVKNAQVQGARNPEK